MWGYAIRLVLALLIGAGPVLAETQSVIDPIQAPQPPKDSAATSKKPPQSNAALIRERERAAAERRKREEAEARAQAAAKETARLRAAEQNRQAADAARLRAAEQAARAAEAARAKAEATRQAAATRSRTDMNERRKREAAEARAQAAEKETAKLRAAEQARLEQDAAMAAVEREAAAARIEAVEAERRKREAAEARAWAAEKEIERLRTAEQERRRGQAEREATTIAHTEWTQRLALLERLRGQLTLSRALAILLDVNQKEELAMLLELEAVLKTDPMHSAYALSVNPAGQLAAGRGWRSRTPELAAVTAVSFCSKGGGESCRSVMVNGRFLENDFLEVARQFGKLDVVAVRGRYLKALRAVRESSPWAHQSQDALPLSRLERY